MFNIDKTELIRYPQVRESEEYEVPATVKKLGLGSFIGGENLKNIKLDTNLEEIDEYALACCTKLEKINLESVKKIGKYSFYYCNLVGKLNLNSIEILEECAFYRDLMYIDIDNSIKVCNCMDISEVVLGNNIQYIGRSSLPRGIVLYIYSPNPPILASSYFQFSKIYVPSESVDLYKNSSNWENFKEIIYPIS
ncbi:leucine-rich repeat protein [Paraclostridium sp. AKS73]|uniref:leucine-rich repeat protein n=1 Tax=Paraclostridium sp. AKS73 TaxID=2876116 RepID=UPI0021DFC2D1|nr:leucine-rich repeat domain-containing protein [Paraclostridium sp. AKS73]MCU9814927.1 leucine-rich repeat domain-containing protein [Paraclostridium sp. AKS73]